MVMRTRKTRLISLFVLAFVCLNAVGAACVGFCRVTGMPDAATKQSSHHCEMALKAEPDESVPSIGKDLAAKPCPMMVSFFGGPVEKHQAPIVKTIAASTRPIDGFQGVLLFTGSLLATFSYRGPPLLDRRAERIKHRLLLI